MSVISITAKSSRWTDADADLLDAVMDDDLKLARVAFQDGARTMAYHTHADGGGEGPFWTLLSGTVPDPHDDNFSISLTMLALFIRQGANLNHHHADQDATPLWAACQSGAGNAFAAVKMLIEGGSVPHARLILEGVRSASEPEPINSHGDVLLPPDLPKIWDVIWDHLDQSSRDQVLGGGPFLGLGSAPLNPIQMARARWLLSHGARLETPFVHEGVDCSPVHHLDPGSLSQLRASLQPTAVLPPPPPSPVTPLHRRSRSP